MSISLAEALQAVDLKPGQTYRCEVKGNEVEVRVLESQARPKPLEISESDLAPTDAWVELPKAPPVAISRSQLVPPKLPDVPEIPKDGEEA